MKTKQPVEGPAASPPAASDGRRAAELALTKPRTQIDISTLILSGQYMHQDGEAAAFQRMSASTFSKWMRRRDPATGLSFRQIFDNARAHGRATILRRARELMDQDKNPSAAVTMTKFVLANEFGWSEKRVDEQRGTVNHRHTHEAIPTDEKMKGMSDAQLADLAAGMGGAGKPVTRH